jgi:L-lactate dehydrogenase complex protein LldG
MSTLSTRDEMLARIRRAQGANTPAAALPAVPRFEAPAARFEHFAAALERMGGKVAPLPEGVAPDAHVRALFPDAKVIVSATPEVTGTRPLGATQRPADLDDVDVGVVRARLGVAETGSVLLTEAELGIEALGFLAQHLVVLLDPAALVASVHDAYAEPAFATARYQILMTGPSATADIEGVLIHGAQGIRSLTVVPCA